jgi:serine protease Do
MVARVYNDIIRTGKVTRGSIGIEWSKADDKPELFKALGTSSGVMISKVQKNGPAEKAGLKADDIIIAMNGKPVKNGEDLVSRVSEAPVNSNINVTVDRDGKHMDFAITVMDRAEVFKDRPEFAELHQPQAEEPATPSGETRQYKFGIKLHALTDAERTNMGMDAKGGLLVQTVDSDSFAEDIGLMEKDVILSINRQPVTSVDDVKRIQGTLKPGDAVAFHIMRPSNAGRGHASQWNTFFLSGALPKE